MNVSVIGTAIANGEHVMPVEVQVRYDKERGCGWRKPGGIYLISDSVSAPCGKLPLPLTVCPCCSAGIKFTRGFTWVDGDALFRTVECKSAKCHCASCPMNADEPPSLGRCGLLWIGEATYKTPGDWLEEATKLGISRRISTVPLDFKLGETWIMVAHIKAIAETCKLKNPRDCEICKGKVWHYTPAVFQVFRPQAIEYVVTGKETEEELERLVKRGITPVRIERVTDQPQLVSEATN